MSQAFFAAIHNYFLKSSILTHITGNSSQSREILFFPLCWKGPKPSSETCSSALLSLFCEIAYSCHIAPEFSCASVIPNKYLSLALKEACRSPILVIVLNVHRHLNITISVRESVNVV